MMQNQAASNDIDVKRIILELWRYRLLFLLMILFFLTISFLYTKFVSETYTIHSTILIKTKSDRTSTSSSEYMNVYDMIGQDVTMSNEISVLQSTPIIKETLEELGVRISYYLQEANIPKQFSFGLRDIYNGAPFIVIYTRDHVQPINALFYVKIIDNQSYTISCDEEKIWLFNYNTEEYESFREVIKFSGNYQFGELVETENFSFKLLLHSTYNPSEFVSKDLYFKFNDLYALALQYKGQLEINYSTLEGSIAEISYTGNNIQKSVDFVNTLTAKYIEKNLQEKTYLATKTMQYVDRQLNRIYDTLSRTEQQLQNFRRTYNIMDVNVESSRLYTQLDKFEEDRENVNSRLNLLQQMKAYFESNKEDASILIVPSSMGLSDPILNALIEELLNLNREKEQLIQSNQLRNPRLQTLNASIENLTRSIAENIDYSIQSTTNELQIINNRIAEINTEFSRLPQTQRRLLGIERQFNLTQDVYNSLMETRIQAEIVRSSTMPDCEIIEPARFISVASPRKFINYGLALFLGLILPSSYVFGRKYFSDKFEDIEDIKRHTSLTLIGDLPENKKVSGNILVNEPADILAESFRSLRSNIDFFLLGERHKIILVTSSMPQEGKSMTALNLSTAFAMANCRTLLLRLDLRKSFEPDDHISHQELVGISDYLIRQANLEDIITQTEIPNLEIITSGNVPPNPVELLTSDRMKDLLLQVKQQYDYVIIDTSPFGLVSDPFILMKFSDLNIFIARLGIITKKAYIPNMEEISSKGLKNMYLLINGIKPSSSSYAKYKTYPYRKRSLQKGSTQKQKVAVPMDPGKVG